MRLVVMIVLVLALGPGLSPAQARSADPPADRHPLVRLLDRTVERIYARLDPQWLLTWHPAASVGRGGRGRLLFAVRMPATPGMHIRNPGEAWTVPEVVVAMQAAHAAVEAAHPGGPDMVIGDISRRNGGRFPPHRSHQHGLDVDMRYFLHGEQLPDYTYRRVTAENFDTARVWTLLKHFYDSGGVDLVFVDYRHQRRLYRYARRELKMTAEELAPILSYPTARFRRDALVRHVPAHYNHIHVRFKAPIARALGRMWSYREAIAMQRRIDLSLRGQFDYVVRRGDTLSGIAAANRVSVADLRAWNKLPRRLTLRPGRVLKVMRTN